MATTTSTTLNDTTPTSDATLSESELAALCEELRREEAELEAKKVETVRAMRKSATREVEKGLEALKRTLPELDLVSKTSTELHASIKKTMERADVVSSRVRELDSSRSNAVSALEYVRCLLAMKECLNEVGNAVRTRNLESAADFVRRFDRAAEQILTVASSSAPDDGKNPSIAAAMVVEMDSYRGELMRLVGNKFEASWERDTLQRVAAAAPSEWLAHEYSREALHNASVLSTARHDEGAGAAAFGGYLASLLREKSQMEMMMRGLAEFAGETASPPPPPKEDSMVFMDVLKVVLNASAQLVDFLSPSEARVVGRLVPGVTPQGGSDLPRRTVCLKLVRAVTSETDRQCVILFDRFLSIRRLHERASQVNDETTDLARLNYLIVESCFLMQHVETFDRFLRTRAAEWRLPELVSQANFEYKRTLQELAGVYTLLEKGWMGESMARAVRSQRLQRWSYAVENGNQGGEAASEEGEETPAEEPPLMPGARETDPLTGITTRSCAVSSIVEDAFYIAQRAVRRALSTGSCDAACGCVNLVSAALEDVLAAGLGDLPGDERLTSQAIAILSSSGSDLTPLNHHHHHPGTSSSSTSSTSTANAKRAHALLEFARLNSLEQCVTFFTRLHGLVSSSDSVEDVDKLRSCADGLLDCALGLQRARFEYLAEYAMGELYTPLVKPNIDVMAQINYKMDEAAYERDDGFAARIAHAVAFATRSPRANLAPVNYQKACETLLLACAEEMERGTVTKRFTQLGGLRLDRDVRLVMQAFAAAGKTRQEEESASGAVAGLDGTITTPKVAFARLLQMSAMLSISSLEEAHEVWDSFHVSSRSYDDADGDHHHHHHQSSSSAPSQQQSSKRTGGVREGLTTKEAKRLLGLRLDFDQKVVQKLKL